MMKYYQCPVSQTIGVKAYAKDRGVPVSCKSSAPLKPVRSVHFPNDIVFLDCVRHGELERIGLFLRARRVNLDTIYHSGGPITQHTTTLISDTGFRLLDPKHYPVPRSFSLLRAGMAAVHEAVLSGNLECVKLLVHYGANIVQKDEEGWTPLHMACSDGFPHIAR